MPRKAIKACQGKGQGALKESGCAVPFPPQDLVVRVNLSRLSHNTRILWAGIHIKDICRVPEEAPLWERILMGSDHWTTMLAIFTFYIFEMGMMLRLLL